MSLWHHSLAATLLAVLSMGWASAAETSERWLFIGSETRAFGWQVEPSGFQPDSGVVGKFHTRMFETLSRVQNLDGLEFWSYTSDIIVDCDAGTLQYGAGTVFDAAGQSLGDIDQGGRSVPYMTPENEGIMEYVIGQSVCYGTLVTNQREADGWLPAATEARRAFPGG